MVSSGDVAQTEVGDAIVNVAKLAAIEIVNNPCLVPWVNVRRRIGSGIEFFAEKFSFILSGEIWESVASDIYPLLNGANSVEEVVGLVSGKHPRGLVLLFIKALQQNSLLIAGKSAEVEFEDRNALYLFSHHSSDPGRIAATIASARIAIVAQPSLAKLAIETLESVGLTAANVRMFESAGEYYGVRSKHEPEELLVVLAEESFSAEFDRANHVALMLKQRWLRIVVGHRYIVIGPTFLPFQTGCQNCLQLRMAANGVECTESFGQARRHFLPSAEMPAAKIAANLAVLEICRLLTAFSPPTTIGRYHRLDGTTFSMSNHTLLKVPRCPSCGHGFKSPQIWNR